MMLEKTAKTIFFPGTELMVIAKSAAQSDFAKQTKKYKSAVIQKGIDNDYY